MLMTDGEIKEALSSGELGIEPYDDPGRQQPCSYDARIGKQALVSRDHNLVDLSKANIKGSKVIWTFSPHIYAAA